MSDPSAAAVNAGNPPPSPYAGFPTPPPLEGSLPPHQAPHRDDTNGLAIAALATSLVGLLCGGSVLGLIFGIIALVQIRRTGQRGRGMAISGVVIGALQVAAGIAFIAWGISIELRSDDLRNGSGEITSSGDIALEDLVPGDCANGLSGEEEIINDIPAVPCAEPHEGEVFAVLDLPDGEWPGQDAVHGQATAECVDRLATYSAEASEDESVYVLPFSPTRSGWRTGDREVICFAYFLDGERTGSLRD